MSDGLLDFLLLRDLNTRMVVIGTVVLGIGSAAIGSFAFLRKRALVGDAVAHSVLPGVAIAFLVVGSKEPLALLIGAAIAGWISMIAMEAIVRHSRLREDAAIGLALSVFFGLGILLLTHIQSTGAGAQSGLDKFLFGQAASLVQEDVVVFTAVAGLMILAVVLAFKEFRIISFDGEFAASLGYPLRFLEMLLTTLLVLAVVIGIQAVGVVLMAAMLITPAAAARYWTDRLGVMIVLASIFGAVSGVLGAFVSWVEPGMPTGPWIVVVATAIFALSIGLAPRRGILSRILRHWRNRRSTLAENILKTLYKIEQRTDLPDSNEPGAWSMEEIRQHRRMSPGLLRRGLHRLQRQGYVSSNPHGEWRLTGAGRQRGARITRLHRLWEVYLTEYVKIAPDHVHDDAEAIEHVLTPELEARLTSLLRRPTQDPHAQEIPYQ